MTGMLVLEDSTVFVGDSVGAEGFVFGEAVFTTAMTGYQEIVTDPSYSEQLVAFTAPMVGNYGVEPDRCESKRPHARAVVMREARGPAWTDWLHDHGLIALSGIDTRSLVVHLREAGAMRAIAIAGEASVEEAVSAVKVQPAMAGRSLATGVSTREPYVYSDAGTAQIAVLDYGCKRSILRRLAGAGAAVTVFPHDADADELAEFDGVVLSNGPGDPEPLHAEVAQLQRLLGRTPVLGICLGHQLLALACGLQTYKLPFGHRGANHPVKDLETGRIDITSQNHGFAVVGPGGEQKIEGEESVRWDTDFGTAELSQLNLYDRTVEGLVLRDVAGATVQYHPEAGPGPHDARHLFDRFLELAA